MSALWLTLWLALCTTALLAVVGIPFCYWLAGVKSRGRVLIESAVLLPLILPPTVLGFFLLVAASPDRLPGRAYRALTGGTLPFTFAGLLVASVIANLPFATRPFLAAFRGVDSRLVEASWCLGESRWGTFSRIVLPLASPGILAGLLLTFAHVIGEFGVVLMVGGNIPGVTRTLSMLIYDDVQALDYQAAGRISLILLAVAYVILCAAQLLERRSAAAS